MFKLSLILVILITAKFQFNESKKEISILNFNLNNLIFTKKQAKLKEIC